MGIAAYFSNKFYDNNSSNVPEIGSIYWVPVPQVVEVPHILDVTRADPTEHEIAQFSFVELGSQHYNAKNRLPIKKLNLDDNSELMVAKSKKRPCVIVGLGSVDASAIANIKDVAQMKQANHLKKAVYLVAPMYSCSTFQEKGTFGPIITSRIRALHYPHLCYFTPFNPAEANSNPGSILRLDQVFPTYLGRGCDPHQLKVKDEVMDIVQDQLKIICGNLPTDDFIEIKELLEESLPEN